MRCFTRSTVVVFRDGANLLLTLCMASATGLAGSDRRPYWRWITMLPPAKSFLARWNGSASVSKPVQIVMSNASGWPPTRYDAASECFSRES